MSVRPAAGLRAFAASWNWPPICCLPPYAPDVNPVEEVKTPGEAASCPTASSVPPEQPIQRLRRGLRHIQHRSHPMDGCLAETGLTIEPA
ncbi:hypothetical protein ACWD0D_34245 [Streptomyces griseoincarnatus]